MRPFVLLLALAVIGALAFTLLSSDERAPRGAARPAANETSRVDATTPLSPVASDRAAAGQPAAQAGPAPSLEDGGQPVAVGLDFTWKYGEDERERLGERLTVLEGEVQLAADREFKQRFEHGEFESYAVQPNDARSVEEIVDALIHDGELCSTRVIADPSNGATLDTRPRAIEVVCLVRGDHTELYRLVDERDWLRAYIGRLDAKHP